MLVIAQYTSKRTELGVLRLKDVHIRCYDVRILRHHKGDRSVAYYLASNLIVD